MENNVRNNKAVVTWLLIGVAMIVIQILIGGITRLTESGLSITEWKPITGMLPPMNVEDWMQEFDKYRTTDQFKYVHQDFTLSEFKFIYFWEWFHRAWARLLGVVFIIGFVYLLAKKKFHKNMITPMIVLFLLGALQGLVGWIMVKSGLVPEKFYVGHVELTTHFIAALILLSYTLWFALKLSPKFEERVYNSKLKNFLIAIAVLFFLQLIYGGFMAGLKAAQTAPTWPSINGNVFPPYMMDQQPAHLNFFNNNLMVHFIHRNLAYLLTTLILFFFMYALREKNRLFSKLRNLLPVLILIQVVLGILTVMSGTKPAALVWYGVSHQFVAMLLVMLLTSLFYVVRRKPAF